MLERYGLAERGKEWQKVDIICQELKLPPLATLNGFSTPLTTYIL